jgi:hypothetical protein
MFDSEYLGAWDLVGKDVTVAINRVVAGTVIGSSGRKAKKPIVYFEGKEKGLLINKTNAKTISTLYGNDTAAWAGKLITLFPTQTQFGSETMDCIRVRSAIPHKASRPAAVANATAEREPGEDG